jgi:hypothetical protein
MFRSGNVQRRFSPSIPAAGPSLLIALFVASLSLNFAGAMESDSKNAAISTSALATAEKLIDAFNRHDPRAMASLVSSDFELYYFDDKGVAGLALRGPGQLASEMTSYFADRPTVGSRIVGAVDGPIFVSFREQIVRGEGGRELGQSSLAVYEVHDSLIRRVWYYPAEDALPTDGPSRQSAPPPAATDRQD